MFQGLLKRAERSIDSAVAKIVDRALVTAPLVVAGGFATASATAKLVDIYGHVTAYALMAALFAVIGVVTMAVVGTGNAATVELPEPEQAAEASAPADSPPDVDLLSDLMTPEVRAFLTSAAPMAVPGLARGIARNLPLILFLALVGYIVSRFAGSPTEETSKPADTPAGEPEGTNASAVPETSGTAAAA